MTLNSAKEVPMSQNEITTLATETIAQNTNETTEKKTKFSLSSALENEVNAIESRLSNKEEKKLQKVIVTLKSLGVTTKDVEEKLADLKSGETFTDADYISFGKKLVEVVTEQFNIREAKLAEKANEKKTTK
jgi:hypothetical protein